MEIAQLSLLAAVEPTIVLVDGLSFEIAQQRHEVDTAQANDIAGRTKANFHLIRCPSQSTVISRVQQAFMISTSLTRCWNKSKSQLIVDR